MYLSANRRLGKYSSPESEKKGKEVRKLFPEMFLTGNLEYINIEFEAGYWRKANAIHKWFVENCQDGVDECQETYVSRKKLAELKKLCEEVLASKDTDKLQTQSGFFFGGTDYDEWYWADIEQTIKICEKCLALPEEWDFSYRSSW